MRLSLAPAAGVLAALQAVAAVACGVAESPRADGQRAAQATEIARAIDVAEGRDPAVGRVAIVATARSMQALADRPDGGAGSAQGVDLQTLAGRLFERAWRVAGDDDDGSQALALYRAAASNSAPAALAGACAGALRAARLAGDLAHDASVTYVEVVRARRRFKSLQDDGSHAAAGRASARGIEDCTHEMDRMIGLLDPFRPSPGVSDDASDRLLDRGSPATGSSAALAPLASRAPQIVRIDAWPGPDSARIAVAIDRAVPYRSGEEVVAGAPAARTFLELDGVDVADAPREMPLAGIVTRVRADPTSTGSRITLDLDGQVWRRIFYMREPFRIIVDVARRPPNARGTLRAVSRVVLDAGHGGKDTGAVGPAGAAEKDVTLDIVRRAARILTDQGLEVLLTRDDDSFVSLEERTARANSFSADLFVSVHCNASDGGTRRGLETYVLDTTRDEIAARIAARENETTQASSADVASMLSRMRLADQAERSTDFAKLMERSAVATLRMKYADTVDGGVHPAGFYVLVGARMPSVLFESSYISNPVEETRLATAEYRQLLADAIANAVRAYREGRRIRSAR